MAALTLRVFLSSPGDVGLERLLAVRVLERLQGEFATAVAIEPILWEDLPLRATAHFQEQIVPPSQTDIVITILWSRLGTRLPADRFRRDDGSLYQSGTEWEIEDAVQSFRQRGTPDLFVYRKTSDPQVSLSREDEIAERLRQKKALDAFVDRWFGNPSDSFKAAFTTFETPDQFEEKLETHLRAVIRDRLPADRVGAGPPASWYRGSPFRRLEVFEFEHASILFGRTHAICSICDALIRQSALRRGFVLVLGMSGCGKSSLVRAGVMPVLAQPGVVQGVDLWRRCVFRPGDFKAGPVDALAHALLAADALPELEALDFPAPILAENLRRAPRGADGPVRMALARAGESEQARDRSPHRPEVRLAVVVDQLEEIFTDQNMTAADRETFVAALTAVACSGVACVVATMRSDFYARCAELPDLAALKEGSGQYDLLPPTFGEIGRMIRHPASAAGLAFEEDPATGRGLDEALHESAFKNPESLPLLEFTLDELYRRRADGRLLNWSAYRALGGIEGAIGHHAESVFQGLNPQVQGELPALLRALVTVGTAEGATVAARRAARDAVASTPARMVLLDALIEARLVVADRSPDGSATVRLSHEALIRHWGRLSSWVEVNRKELDVRAQVGTAAERWRRGGGSTDLLLPEGAPLDEAHTLFLSWGDELPQPERDFITRSASRARHNRWLKRGAVVALAALTLAAFVLSGMANKARQDADAAAAAASRSKSEAIDDRKKADAAAAREAEAAQQAKSSALRAQAHANLADARRLAALSGLERDKHLDRSLLLAVEALNTANTLEARSSLFDALLSRPEIKSFLHPPEGRITSVAFNPDGKTLAAGYVGSGGGTSGVVLWDLSRRQLLTLQPLPVGEGEVATLSYSPDGKTLAADFSTGTSGGVVLWDVDRRERLTDKPLGVTEGEVMGLAFSPDGKSLAAGYWGGGIDLDMDRRRYGGVVLWDVSRRLRLADWPLAVPEGSVMSVAFSSNGKTLAAGFVGSSDGLPPFEDAGRGGPSGVVLWDAARRQRLAGMPLAITEGEVDQVAFSPDGKTLAAGYSHPGKVEGGVIFWDVAGRQRLTGEGIAIAEAYLQGVAFSPDGKTLAAGLRTKEKSSGVVLWDVAGRQRLTGKPLRISEGEIHRVAFSPDGKTLAAGYGGGVVLWDVGRNARLTEKLAAHEDPRMKVTLSPDGSVLAAISWDHVLLWDLRRRAGPARLGLAATVPGVSVKGVAFSPDGKNLAVGWGEPDARAGGVELWDVGRRERLGDLPLARGESDIESVAFSPDARTLAVGYGDLDHGNGGIILWEVGRRERLPDRPLDVANGGVRSVAFSPDGTTLAAAYWIRDREAGVALWDVGRRERLADLPLTRSRFNINSVAFSPDGQILAATCTNGVLIWDVGQRPPLACMPLAIEEAEGLNSVIDSVINSVTFSHDGKAVAAAFGPIGTGNCGVVIWDVGRRERLVSNPLGFGFDKGHGQGGGLAFASDGKTLVALHPEDGLVLWDIDQRSWRLHAEQIANRNLTLAEWRQYFPDAPYHATFLNLPVPSEEAADNTPRAPASGITGVAPVLHKVLP